MHKIRADSTNEDTGFIGSIEVFNLQCFLVLYLQRPLTYRKCIACKFELESLILVQRILMYTQARSLSYLKARCYTVVLCVSPPKKLSGDAI